MLILIAGITGNIGQHLASWALHRGHKVRGLCRNPQNLSLDITKSLDRLYTADTYYDPKSLDKACAEGVEAVVCAYAGLPELHLEAQLFLLRAAERAGIKRFLAASWNYDWRKIRHGEEPVYDAAIAFCQHVTISSTIRPVFVLSGMLAEVFFGVEGQTGFTPAFGGVWEPRRLSLEDGREDGEEKEGRMEFWGDGSHEWCFTTEEDAGMWGIEAITAENAEEGGFVTVCSWKSSLLELKSVYEKVRGIKVMTHIHGTIEELEALAIREKERLGSYKMWEWHRYWFLLFTLKGTWDLTQLENQRFPAVTATSLEQFLEAHPEI